MTNSKYEQFIQLYEAGLKTNVYLRPGQLVMNTLYSFDKWTYSKVVIGEKFDCFYNDKQDLTLSYLKELWDA